ncbi:MAG TPA: CDP-diacylglycerol--glycerol-3-phosphate 3-phosphatidyltransferase [Actinomycetota bacterium]|nr:CDP-diacylglycerol--glycerol-3-phosphate 3-phosphatidyltransferase [Actinomycetota bacterium]
MNERVAKAASLLRRLTYVRVLLVPVVMWLVLDDPFRRAYGVAAGLFAFAAATDFFDGYLARRWGATTTLGSFLDTTADKLLVSGVLVALVQIGRASPWIAAIIIGRELLILGLRGVVAADGTVMRPSIWGKLKANAQFLAIFLAILRIPPELGPLFLDQWVMLVAAAVTVVSAVEYLARFSGSLSPSRRS